MTLSSFKILILISWGLSFLFMVPEFAPIFTILTAFVGFFIMVAIMTVALYSLVFVPRYVSGSALAKRSSRLLFVMIAIGPCLFGHVTGAIVRGIYLSDDKAASTLEFPARTIDFQGLPINGCETTCRGLLTGGMVEKLRVYNGKGEFQYYFTSGARGPFFDQPQPEEFSDIVLVFEEPSETSRRALLGFQVTSKSRLSIKDGRTHETLFQASSLSYETATFLTYVTPFLFSETGNKAGGWFLGRSAERKQSIGELQELPKVFGELGISLGNPDMPIPRTKLHDLRKTISTVPGSFGNVRLEGKVRLEARRAIGKWLSEITDMQTVPAEDLDFLQELLLRQDDLQPTHLRLSLEHPHLRDVILEGFFARLEGTATNLHDRYYEWLLQNLPAYRFPQKTNETNASRMLTVVDETLNSSHDENTLRLILIAGAFGIDPVPFIDRIDFTSRKQSDVGKTLEWLHRAACTATKEERSERKESLARALVEITGGHDFQAAQVSGILRVLSINGMGVFVDEFTAEHMPSYDAEHLHKPSRGRLFTSPELSDLSLKLELEDGCGYDRPIVVFLNR